MSEKSAKRHWMDNPLLRSKVHSANVKLFPEAGLGYLVGPALALFSNAMLNGYLNRYYTDVLNLTTWAKDFSIWLPVISVIAVIIGNLLVGKLMERHPTMAGKARPLLLLSIPLIIASFFLIFFVPYPQDGATVDSALLTLIMVAIGYNLYYAVAYPFYYVAHSALVNLSTRNSKHRGLLATASNASGLAAIGLVNMVFPLFQSLLFNDNDRLASYNAWRVFIIALVVATGLGILIEYFFTRERITEETLSVGSREKQASRVSTAKQAKACLRDKYWWLILVFFLLYQLGGQLKNNSGSYYTQWLFADASGQYTYKNGGNINSLINTVGMVPTALGMLLVWPLANKVGKARAILLGSILAVAGGILGIVWGGNNVGIAVASYAIKALGGAPAMYISLALLSDVLDHQEAVYGFRTDGFTMSIYGSIMIGTSGIANGIINGLLSATGYDASLISTGQSEATKTALSWIFFGGETLAFAAIAILFIFMNVEKFSKCDRLAIVEDQKAKCVANGQTYVDPEVRLVQEQQEIDQKAEISRQEELKARCAKKGLNYEQEEASYEEKVAAKEAQTKAKQKEKEDKAALKKKQKEDQLSAKEFERKNALRQSCAKQGLDYEKEEAAYEEKMKAAQEEKAAKQWREDAAIQAEFDAIRSKAREQFPA